MVPKGEEEKKKKKTLFEKGERGRPMLLPPGSVVEVDGCAEEPGEHEHS